MFLRVKKYFKDGQENRYWSVVENRRVAEDRVVHSQALYLGEIIRYGTGGGQQFNRERQQQPKTLGCCGDRKSPPGEAEEHQEKK